MSSAVSVFKEKSAIKAADLQHRKTINYNIGKYNAVVPQGKKQFSDLEFDDKMLDYYGIELYKKLGLMPLPADPAYSAFFKANALSRTNKGIMVREGQ